MFLSWVLPSLRMPLFHRYLPFYFSMAFRGSCNHCIVLYLDIYIALLAGHTNQKRFQCERPREKRAVLYSLDSRILWPVVFLFLQCLFWHQFPSVAYMYLQTICLFDIYFNSTIVWDFVQSIPRCLCNHRLVIQDSIILVSHEFLLCPYSVKHCWDSVCFCISDKSMEPSLLPESVEPFEPMAPVAPLQSMEPVAGVVHIAPRAQCAHATHAQMKPNAHFLLPSDQSPMTQHGDIQVRSNHESIVIVILNSKLVKCH